MLITNSYGQGVKCTEKFADEFTENKKITFLKRTVIYDLPNELHQQGKIYEVDI